MKSIRKKDNNPAIPHVESPHYSGLCRRHHQNLPRASCIEVCSIADHNPDTKAFIGKCTQIGPGGCRIILHEHATICAGKEKFQWQVCLQGVQHTTNTFFARQ